MHRWVLGLVALLSCWTSALAQSRPPVVLAAASLQESLTAAASVWARKGHPVPVISFAASSALARQIEAGAPADIFISADEAWMDYLQGKALLRKGTRTAFLTNRLVLVTPAQSRLRLTVAPRFPLARALGNRRLAMADPDTVPAGRYGKEALVRLGVWGQVQAKVVRAENVRAALVLVARGEVPLGVVYATDARAAGQGVRIAAWFPASSHAPITYPAAILARSRSPEASDFLRFLLSREGKAIFARYGFGTR